MQLIFWLLLIIIFYVYIGYPLSILFVSRMRMIRVDIDTKYIPKISLIIAAYNEEQIIEAKIRNSLALDYPKGKLQIIIASDASEDRTDEIVKRYENSGIILSRQTTRTGKSLALNTAVSKLATGEILVFTDATTRISKNALLEMAKYYNDPMVGAICGNLKFKVDSSNNEGIYWRYEQWIRRLEGKIGCLPFVAGAFYSIRKQLYSTTPGGIPDDSHSPLNTLKKDRKVIFADDAVAFETAEKQGKNLFKIKVRGIVRELNSIFYNRELLNPFRYFLTFFILINHRVLRYSVPFLLIILLVINLHLLLLKVPIYKIIFSIQAVFYGLTLLKALVGSRMEVRIISLPFYFCLVNYAAFIGVVQFILRQKYATWEPVR